MVVAAEHQVGYTNCLIPHVIFQLFVSMVSIVTVNYFLFLQIPVQVHLHALKRTYFLVSLLLHLLNGDLRILNLLIIWYLNQHFDCVWSMSILV